MIPLCLQEIGSRTPFKYQNPGLAQVVYIKRYYCSLFTQSCPALCDPMDCSTPGLLVLHYLLEFWLKLMSIESMMPSNHLILCRPNHLIHCRPLLLPPSIFPSIGAFPVSQLFASGGQIVQASASASVLPMNIQCCSICI